MLNQFVQVTGCPREQAQKFLCSSEWQFQAALSMYFDEGLPLHSNAAGMSLLTPANTPATPPNFPDALSMFSQMSTSGSECKLDSSPLSRNPVSPRQAVSPCL